jgi:hypothetical protein
MASALAGGEIPHITHYREPSNRSTLADRERVRASIYIPQDLTGRISEAPEELSELWGLW